MTAIIKLGKSGGPLGITSIDSENVILTPTLRAVRFKHGEVIRVGGKHDGDGILDGIVEANQTVIIRPNAELQPRKYEVITSYNPDLLYNGIVSVPALLEPGTRDLFLQFRSLKKTDLNDFDYIFEFRLID